MLGCKGQEVCIVSYLEAHVFQFLLIRHFDVLGNIDAEGLVDLIFQLLFFHVLQDCGMPLIKQQSLHQTSLQPHFLSAGVSHILHCVLSFTLFPDMLVQAFAATRSATVAVHCTFL